MLTLQQLRLLVTTGLLVMAAWVPTASAQRVFAKLEISQLTVVNDVAEATFKVVVTTEEATAMGQVWLVFDDGIEVSVGDVPAEGSASSEPLTRTFDLSQHIRSQSVPLQATLKYSSDGVAVEQATTVVLQLGQ